MNGLLTALIVWVVGGTAALLLGRSGRAAARMSIASLAGGALVAAPSIFRAILNSHPTRLEIPWQVPGAALALQLDALSAWFLVPALLVVIVAAVYGSGYLEHEKTHKTTGVHWFFYNLLVAAITVVLLARNAVLFLVAWEVMALASFFLVSYHDEHGAVRRAAWTYLVSTHLGTVFLVALFLLLGRSTGSLDLAVWADAGRSAPPAAGLLFVLALIGFGSKAGVMPFHVWLPEAHPVAPSHVSAVLSGVMIKTGIYGLLRTLTFLGDPQPWWGWLLLGLGVGSGLLGVLSALVQQDLKRVLAYSSVENIGIILTGLGLGVTGVSTRLPWLAALGFGGCLVHVFNHAFFKALLFMGAGSVVQATGTGGMNGLGGLARKMPVTAAAFLAGAAAISALPPLNGFIGEWMILFAGIGAIARGNTDAVLAGLAVVAGLALIGGLAVACFARAFGVTFLGEPRVDLTPRPEERGMAMYAPMVFLAVVCVAVGVTAPWWVAGLEVPVSIAARLPAHTLTGVFAGAASLLARVLAVCSIFTMLVAGLALLRLNLLGRRTVATSPTWDCGYARPAPSMQYTASSFAQPIADLFRNVLGYRTRAKIAGALFPPEGSFESEAPDIWLDPVYGRVFRGVESALSRLRWLQHGNVHLYILYIALTLVALWIWTID